MSNWKNIVYDQMISYEIFAKFLFIVGQEDFRTHYTKKFGLKLNSLIPELDYNL